MSPIYCDECRRANGPTAKKCIWCGMPIAAEGAAAELETTRVEIEYVDGIDRFEDAGPVRLIINAEGIEVAELVPGSRSVKIPASSVLEASVVDASTMIECKRERPVWLWRALAFPEKKTVDIKKHDYILTIRYRVGAEVRNAVFHREDPAGLAVVERLARIVSTLVRKT